MQNSRLAALRRSLANRELRVPTDIASGVVFFVLGLVLLLVLPGQINIGQNEVVNGRAFPRMLIMLMMACCAGLVIKDLVKMARKQPLHSKTMNLLVEAKALCIFAILLISYLLCRVTDLFVVGACFCSLAFLVYFRCGKWSYYLITIGGAVLIWASFRYILNVNF